MNVVIRRSITTLAVLMMAVPALSAQEESVPAATASEAVEQFITAVSDSNLARMGELFGTKKGAVVNTGIPELWGQRAIIIQLAFGGITVQALTETASGKDDEKLVATRLVRGNCSGILPFKAVLTKDGWLVHSFDYEAAWDAVNRPCESRNPGSR